jgi:hypothetical protein
MSISWSIGQPCGRLGKNFLILISLKTVLSVLVVRKQVVVWIQRALSDPALFRNICRTARFVNSLNPVIPYASEQTSLMR